VNEESADSSVMLTGVSSAQEMKFFRIGTGGAGGIYFPIGGIIANAISNPPGSRACDKGGNCGVPGLVAMAQSTNASAHNVNALFKRARWKQAYPALQPFTSLLTASASLKAMPNLICELLLTFTPKIYIWF
jgi:TRAP-type uncharacterized transport system substrate-binding protein